MEEYQNQKRGLQWRDALCIAGTVLATLTVIAVFC